MQRPHGGPCDWAGQGWRALWGDYGELGDTCSHPLLEYLEIWILLITNHLWGTRWYMLPSYLGIPWNLNPLLKFESFLEIWILSWKTLKFEFSQSLGLYRQGSPLAPASLGLFGATISLSLLSIYQLTIILFKVMMLKNYLFWLQLKALFMKSFQVLKIKTTKLQKVMMTMADF